MRPLLFTALPSIAALFAAAPALAQDDATPPAPATKPAAKDGAAAKPGLDVSKLPFTEYSIKKVRSFHLPEIQSCYEGVITDLVKNVPEGTVFVTFKVQPSGLTSDIKVDKKKTTLKNDRIQACVTDSITNWEMPKPDDGLVHPLAMPFSLKVSK